MSELSDFKRIVYEPERRALMDRIRQIQTVVDEQANDPMLWLEPASVVGVACQRALRRLHEAVEGKTSAECARAVLD